MVEGRKPRGHPKKSWIENVKKDLECSGLHETDAMDIDLYGGMPNSPQPPEKRGKCCCCCCCCSWSLHCELCYGGNAEQGQSLPFGRFFTFSPSKLINVLLNNNHHPFVYKFEAHRGARCRDLLSTDFRGSFTCISKSETFLKANGWFSLHRHAHKIAVCSILADLLSGFIHIIDGLCND